MAEKLLFELSRRGRRGVNPPLNDTPQTEFLIPKEKIRPLSDLDLPELGEVDVVRHFIGLSKLNYGVDGGFYPLGSCTMKYNPKINEDVARYSGFTAIHPHQPEETVQGALQLMHELERDLCEITGMSRFSLQPAAGAHGELTGIMMVKAFFREKNQTQRRKIIIPDSAHGTNPASAAFCGFEVVGVKSDARGGVDVKELEALANDEVAAIMLTNPNTLGLFDENILQIAEIVHTSGGLVYCDGANMNAILGKARPGDMGVDVLHLNLHKTFSTPHGGGGPGSGPVGVSKKLEPYLPKPVVVKKKDYYFLDYDRPKSIGRVRAYYGNFNVMVKAYAYIRSLGPAGLREVSETAVLNANYLMKKLKDYFDLPYDRQCMHEFVLSGRKLAKEHGVHTIDVAKRLLDYGYHAPTIYFPLIVEEALMIEPTETENKDTLDEFADALIQIAKEAKENPDLVKNAPHNTPIRRLDDTLAARKPNLRWSR